ncbi:cell division protein Fic [Actinokineospora sp. NBRC 105648]|nr:cell division protein Fic [Actinokineospora sp. NBRC 105648]
MRPAESPDLPEALRGTSAFAPRPLPADVVLPSVVSRTAAEAEHALGRLTEAVRRLSVPLFTFCTRVRDAQSSAGLAGSSVELVEAFLLAQGVADDDGHPVSRFVAGSAHGFDRLRAGAALDADLLGEVSAVLTGLGPRSGEQGLRARQGWLGGPGPERAYLLTVPPGALLRSSLDQWSLWVRSESPLPRVAKSALGHLQIELLQPYPEANGHVARLFSCLALHREGLLPDQVLPVSSWLDSHRDEYRAQVRDYARGGPVEAWVEFYAAGIRDQALAQLDLVARLESVRARHLAAVAGGPPSLRRAAAGLVLTPVTTHQRLGEDHGLSEKTTLLTARRLVELGFLSSMDNRAYRKVFLCTEVLTLLALRYPTPPATDEFDPRPSPEQSVRVGE